MLKIFKNKKGKNAGFTLLELIVIIGIIGIMTGVSLVSLNSSKRHFALKASQSEVASAIKLAQSYALQGKVIPEARDRGEVICGFGFKFNPDDSVTGYQIFYYTTPGDDCYGDKSEMAVEQYELKNGVSLTSPSNLDQSKIYFDIPSASVSTASGAFPKVFEFNSDSTITINSSGLVTEN